MASTMRIKEILSSVQFKVRFISVAPNMDLVLIVSEAEEVLAYRFIQTWAKVWACSRTGVPSASGAAKPSIIGVAWEPSGKYCVIGHSDGSLAYCDVETGAVFVRIELDLAKYEESALTSLRFSNASPLPSMGAGDYYDSLLMPSELIPKYQCSTLPEEQQIIFRTLQRQLLDGMPEQSYLACFGKKLNIYILAGGFVVLAVIQLGSEISPLPLLGCLQFDCKAPSGELAAVCEYKMRNIKSYCAYKLVNRLMASNHRHIAYLARSLTDLIGCQEMAIILISHLSEGLENVLYEFGSKIDTLAASKKTANSGLISADFIQLLLLGRCSAETEQFFTLNMGERGLQRLSSSLHKNFGGLLKQSISTLASIADRMVLVASRLMSLLKYEQRLGEVAIQDGENQANSINLAAAMHRGALQFRLKIAQLHSVAQQDVGQLTSFIKFLQYEMNYLTAKQNRDSSMASQRMDANKELAPLSQEDIKSVIAFIQRNFVEDYENGKCQIRFDRISQFFKADASVDTDNILQNPWISFMVDVETTPLVVGGAGANDIAADLGPILPKNDLEFSLVKSLQSFSLTLKSFVSALVVSLSTSYSADWCCKLPISNLGDSVISADSSLPICGAFIDRDQSQLLALRVDLTNREARVEQISFFHRDAAAMDISSGESSNQSLVKVNHILAATSADKTEKNLGLYVVLENLQNGENFGHLIAFSERNLCTKELGERSTTFKKLDAVPACVLLPATISAQISIDKQQQQQQDAGNVTSPPLQSKTVSFGRLNASTDMLYIASTGRSLIILQPGFQLLRAFPGLEVQS